MSEEKGFDMGCVDYITKPISASILKARVKNHLALVRLSLVEEINHAAILMLGEAGHFNDDCTGNHIWRMSEYAYTLAMALKLDSDFCFNIKYAAAMHDTGKIGIDNKILQKPGKLNAAEWEEMKQHPEIGYNILKKNKTPLFQMAAEISRYHHEKWDGSGYPFGLMGDNIPISARIIAISDVFDALVSERPYKKPWKIEDVVTEMSALSGTHFDPHFIQIFLSILPSILSIKSKFDEK